MSRATIKELYWEIDREEDREDMHPNNTWNDYKNIELVPRKMVEMIIEKCKEHASGPKPSDYIVGVSNEADLIKRYAESLLKQFEEDE